MSENGPSGNLAWWTLRGQGLGLWPKVVEGPGFEDEEEIHVVALSEVARHLRNMAVDPSWKREVQVAFEYAAGTFDDAS